MKELCLKFVLKIATIRSQLLKLFVFLHNFSYKMISKIAVAETGGLHPKHEIMKYYNFFKENVSEDDNVLDVGCGNGYVANKVAEKAKKIVGIDINKHNIEKAKKLHHAANIEFIVGDATNYPFQEKQDVILLSNVLEHIEKRVELLLRLGDVAPKILIRVPLISRSWVDFFKMQRSFKYKLDSTHQVEYLEEEIFEEIKAAKLQIENYHVRWGEIFIVANRKQDAK